MSKPFEMLIFAPEEKALRSNAAKIIFRKTNSISTEVDIQKSLVHLVKRTSFEQV